jgi:DNA-binding LacI/PurR family transcriptional regulator
MKELPIYAVTVTDMSRPNMNEIAERLGVSKMTVSRALRGERHVKPEMMERVKAVALELGYVPDPEVGRLMTYLRETRARPVRQTLAFVWTDPADHARRTPWASQLLVGAQRRANELGYTVEAFAIEPGKMTAGRLAKVLEHRGVRGMVLSPLISRSRGHLRLPWERFSTVVIGLGFAKPALHRVHHHHFMGMLTALRQLRKEGYRRIGYCASAVLDQRMFGAWSASFLVHHPLGARAAADLLHLPPVVTRAGFLEWCQEKRPEVVLESGYNCLNWLPGLPVQQRPVVVSLNWSAERPEVPGIDQRAESIGRGAVDLLVEQLRHNERGVPAQPKIVLTEGVWRAAERRGA